MSIVALGDSITRGRGGSPLLRVHPQSWVLWLAEAMELPVLVLARDAARAEDVLRSQLPRVGSGFDLACLYVGANDARSVDFSPDAFQAAVMEVVDELSRRAARLLVLTIPLDLGRPRAGADVVAANAILRAAAASVGATVCSLDDFAGWRWVLPDAVHPTAPGQVQIAERAAAALREAGVRVPLSPAALADEEHGRRARAALTGRARRRGTRAACAGPLRRLVRATDAARSPPPAARAAARRVTLGTFATYWVVNVPRV